MGTSIKIFCDGASSKNPGPSGWGVIISCDKENQVIELGGFFENATNNQMEVLASLEALSWIEKQNFTQPLDITLYTDSSYLIQGITGWVFGWEKRGWKTLEGEPIKNEKVWKNLWAVVKKIESRSGKISWTYVPGHAGVPGNERVDQIAQNFSQKKSVQLFHGEKKTYSISLEVNLKNNQKIKPYYLSLIDGELLKHATWAECEARVKGKKGAKYKKIETLTQEEETLKAWGQSF